MKNKEHGVAYIVEDKNSPQFRYRVKNITDSLKKYDSKWKAKDYLKNNANKIDFEKTNLLVISRLNRKLP